MILSILTALIVSGFGIAKEVPLYLDVNSKKPVSTDGVLRGGVSVEKNLPEEFYGSWAVKSTMIETNNPDLFRNKSVDVWVLSRNGEIVTLSNPASGAISSIAINEVAGKKARFTREKITRDYIETETPEITIEGANFSGEDKLTIKYLRKEKIYKTDVVKYKIEGIKLNGPALKDLFAK